ncbi:nucleoside monophosphate kinase [Candidatus Woesearchaeota archaeon]|nr:nucleoside monophosphate kinase [Candidatus Woesearchaeota archaeon]
MIIIIIGPPGSGKGTVSERLAKEFGFFHLSPGELLREEVKKATIIGKEIQRYIEKGQLVPTHFVAEMLKLELKGKKKVVLDGFPRSLEQAESIQEIKIDRVINLDVSEKQVIERFAGRRICSKGTHGYHLQYLPPKKPGVCDEDGTLLVQRQDDKPEVIKQRFNVYHQESRPVLKYYQKKVQNVDAGKSPDEVYEQVKKILRL